MIEINLNPCPFCGGEAEILKNKKKFYLVRCSRCLCATWPSKNLDIAAKAWNIRQQA